MPSNPFDPHALAGHHTPDLPWNAAAEPWNEEETGEDGLGDETDEDAAAQRWWMLLPDFIKPSYPFDLPPERLPFARHVFGLVGAPRYCPEAPCRRAKECWGGDGPPCFRADRRDLQQVLFLWVMRLYFGCTDEQYAAILRANGNRYAPSADAPDAPRPRRKRRSRGRSPGTRPEARPRSGAAQLRPGPERGKPTRDNEGDGA